MKEILMTTVCLFFYTQITFANVENLTIIQQNWEAAKGAAQSSGKLILIDFYTTWCGPCKRIARYIDEHPDFAKKIGDDYILLKYDAEKDTDLLAQKHHIRSYPTFITLNAVGQVIDKQYGGFKDEASRVMFEAFLQNSIQKHQNEQYIKGISTTLDLGYPEFYERYVNREKRYTPEQVTAFWEKTSDYESELSFIMLYYFGGGTETVNAYFMEHLSRYQAKFGERDTKNVVNYICGKQLSKAVKAKDKVQFENAIEYAQLHVDKADEFVNYYVYQFFEKTNDWIALTQKIDNDLKHQKIDDYQINASSWAIFEYCDEPKIIKKAIGWMKSIIEGHPEYAYLDTYAWLLFKDNQKETAEKYIRLAIDKGKAAGYEVTESEKMLTML